MPLFIMYLFFFNLFASASIGSINTFSKNELYFLEKKLSELKPP